MTESTGGDDTEIMVDVGLLTRRSTFLSASFVGTFVGFIGFQVIDGDAHFFGLPPSANFKILVGLTLVSALAYLTVLGKMASQLRKNPLKWCGLTILLYVGGFLVSYLLMQRAVRVFKTATTEVEERGS